MTATQEKTLEQVAAEALEKQGPVATFAMLQRKPRRTVTFSVNTVDEDGTEVAVRMRLRAISQTDFDDLVEANPPTAKQRQRGASYNIDTFAPALVAACSVEPKLTVEQAKALKDSPDWSGGEFGDIYGRAMGVCNAGLDVPFNARD